MKLRKLQRGKTFKGGNVTLGRTALTLDETTEGATASDRVWVQVAEEGEYKGYAGGQIQFTFDTRIFEQIAANFRNHPSYIKGEDGFGMANVIPWDFHHASEMPATEGTVPATGAPAQGWVQELAVRHNELGKAQLWALTKWLEPARTYIKEGRYQWASVSVIFDAVDARTGAMIGPIMTSIALTNQPFIEGMQKLAAERRYCGMYLEPAEDAEHALEMTRKMLGLPETADAAAVMGELEKLRQWSTTGQTPLGVELDELVGGLRKIFNLPALSNTEEVFVEVDKLVARLVGETGVDETGSTTPPPAAPATTPSPPPDFPGPTLEKKHMKILEILAEKFGVVAKEEAIVEAVDQLIELRGAAAETVGLSKVSATKVVLKATLDDAGVRAKYGPILSALGVEDPDAALDKIAKLMEESTKLSEMAPEFATLKTRQAEADAEVEEEEVETAVASAGVTASSQHYEGLKVALGHLRKSNPDEFNKRYPKELLEKTRATLSKTPVNHKILTTQITASNGGSGGTATPGGAIDVSTFEGANTILKTMAYLRAHDPALANVVTLTQQQHAALHQRASTLVRSGAVAKS